MRCEDFKNYVDRIGMEFPLSEEAEAHLKQCRHCRSHLELLYTAFGELNELLQEDIPPMLWMDIRRNVRDELTRQQSRWKNFLVRWSPVFVPVTVVLLITVAILLRPYLPLQEYILSVQDIQEMFSSQEPGLYETESVAYLYEDSAFEEIYYSMFPEKMEVFYY